MIQALHHTKTKKLKTHKQNGSRNHLMKAAHRFSLYGTLPHWALNVNRHIWHQNAIRRHKIPGVALLKVNQPRPRSSLAVEKPYIGCDIEASTQSLDWVAEGGGQSIRAKASCCWVFHSERMFHWQKARGSGEQEMVWFLLLLLIV